MSKLRDFTKFSYEFGRHLSPTLKVDHDGLETRYIRKSGPRGVFPISPQPVARFVGISEIWVFEKDWFDAIVDAASKYEKAFPGEEIEVVAVYPDW
ncbi:hypothetical protein A2V80_01895 [Candidatus Woesebacteria bacterium RBG_16_39_8b]|uniref:Uncharacterized protein n=1 Tax=Candidatus Woesebacteria bacterium RBG_16_39_8b TaxID=1802482 RepID=A0A1F7XCC5_9BACT|nr:MAG: hypothetical protein A2V80_01895 [Candidatus Woesebacteria bacterium RBG_16_39_8b]